MELEVGGVVEAEGVDVKLEVIMEPKKAILLPGKEVIQRLETEKQSLGIRVG
jgi:hypothetical protein